MNHLKSSNAVTILRALQLRFGAPYTQFRPISSTSWALAPDTHAPVRSPSPPPTSLRLVPEQNHSLVPVPKDRSLFPGLTDFVASAIHRLVLLVTNLRRASANEHYVRRVLQQQLGIAPIDLDLMHLHHPEIFRLSVRHCIEPVVGYLRSQGLSGSALAHILARAPAVLGQSVEDEIMVLCNFLKDNLGNKAMGLVVRHPELLEASYSELAAASHGLRGAGATQEDVSLMLWRYPEMFLRLGEALITAQWSSTGGKALELAAGADSSGASSESFEFRNAIAEELEHIASALGVLRNVVMENNPAGEAGLAVSVSERQIKRAVAAVEEFSIELARLP